MEEAAAGSNYYHCGGPMGCLGALVPWRRKGGEREKRLVLVESSDACAGEGSVLGEDDSPPLPLCPPRNQPLPQPPPLPQRERRQ